MKKHNIGLLAGGFCAAILILLAVISWALEKVSAADNMEVAVGLSTIVILLGLAGWFGQKIFSRVKTSWSNKGGGTMALLAICLLAGALSPGCMCTRIEPGHIGIKVNLYGSQKGVSDLPAVTGMVWYNPVSESIFEYPTFVQTAVWTKSIEEGSPTNEEITFNTKDGLIISADISLSYQLEATLTPQFYVKFRSDKLNTFTHGFMRNVARDAFNEIAPQYLVEEVYGVKKEEFVRQVKERINREVNQYGVKIEQFGFIGALRIPEAVTNALNGKIQATQDALRVENEIRKITAEAKKTVATAEGAAKAQITKAEGEAKANEILTKSITSQLIQWRQLEIATRAVDKWNGQRPMVEGQTGGMLLQLPISTAPAAKPAAK